MFDIILYRVPEELIRILLFHNLYILIVFLCLENTREKLKTPPPQ